MNQGLINRTKKTIENIKQYLTENEGQLGEQELNEVLDELGEWVETLKILEES